MAMRLRRRKFRPIGAGAAPIADDRAPLARRRRGIYLLPNAFTLAALFAGFYATVQAMNQRFEPAALAIFTAMVLDGMDGRVARLTNTQSDFGAQFDSLSDMTSFGVAPALVMYEWALKGLGQWGWAAAFVYCSGAALRLARFNANLGVVDKRFFQGLPSPAAAALVASFVWLAVVGELSPQDSWLRWTAFGVTLAAGLSMVSSAPFYSGKNFQIGVSVPFWVLVAIVLVIFFVSSSPSVVLFGLFACYAVSGYLYWGWRLWRGQSNPARPAPRPAPEASAPREP
jgi:CDP-diacylglycerol---serine O-phosphatidyltransferase